MLETFNAETFNVGDNFKVYYEEEKFIELILEKINKKKYKVPSGFREPFSLIFKGPKEAMLSQGNWKMVQDKIGTFEIFIVPVVHPNGSTEAYYEAVFS
jgi:hypothetical protein